MNTMLKEKTSETPAQMTKTDENRAAQPEERVEESREKVRISLDISPELNDRLQALARDIHGTKSDVLRKSLILLDVAVEARKNGKKFGIADRSDQLTTEIIGI